jgi:hypothetical protein
MKEGAQYSAESPRLTDEAPSKKSIVIRGTENTIVEKTKGPPLIPYNIGADFDQVFLKGNRSRASVHRELNVVPDVNSIMDLGASGNIRDKKSKRQSIAGTFITRLSLSQRKLSLSQSVTGIISKKPVLEVETGGDKGVEETKKEKNEERASKKKNQSRKLSRLLK